MDKQNIIADGEKYLMYNYKRLPMVFEKGEGCKLIDSEGKVYTDFLAGIAVDSLGHSPKVVVDAIIEQAQKLTHVSNYFWIDSQVKLAKILVENSFADKAFFCNSGTEAIEAAIKLARKYASKNYGPEKNEIVAMSGSFHGRTFGALSITDSEKYRAGIGPMPGGFKFAKFNDIEALKAAVTDKTCAVILEPIQGEGGVTAAEEAFLKAAKEICTEKGALLIVDEIQCGIARSGKLFAYEYSGIEPDIMTLAKAIANGLPLGAVLATAKVASAWQPGDHGSTFGGNPVACAAGVATMETIVNGKMWETAADTGAYFAQKLQELVDAYPFAVKVKGKGLLIGLELAFEGAETVSKALEEGFIINCTSGKVLRFVPPLIIEKSDIDALVAVLDKIFAEYAKA